MAMVRVCDICAKPVTAPHKQLKVLSVEEEGTAPRDFKTVKSMDLHDNCYSSFQSWIAEVQYKTSKFKGA